jgi:hypothetical protein
MLTTVRLATAISTVLVASTGALYVVDTIDAATARTVIGKTLLVMAIFTVASVVIQAVSRGREKT